MIIPELNNYGPYYSYADYRSLIDNLLLENKTSGANHDEAMLNYTRQNVQRMNRHDKRGIISEALSAAISQLSKPIKLICLSEAWCGDASQSVPFFEKMNQATEKLSLEILFRDQNLELMDQFLTDGGRSIPKLLFVDSNNNVLANWGPRPSSAQELVNTARAQKEDYMSYSKRLHLWYARNKSQELQAELAEILIALP